MPLLAGVPLLANDELLSETRKLACCLSLRWCHRHWSRTWRHVLDARDLLQHWLEDIVDCLPPSPRGFGSGGLATQMWGATCCLEEVV